MSSALLINECNRTKALGRLDPADSCCSKTARAQFEFALLLAAAFCLGFSLACLVGQPLTLAQLLKTTLCLGGSLARFVGRPLTFPILLAATLCFGFSLARFVGQPLTFPFCSRAPLSGGTEYLKNAFSI